MHFNEASKSWDSSEKIEQALRLADRIKAKIDLRSAKRVLEVGCGTGLLGAHFIESANFYLGVDSSQGMLAVLRSKYPEQAKVSLQTLDLDFEVPVEGEFDLVISSMAFHHLKDPLQTLKNLSSKLKPGSFVAIVDLEKEDGSFHPDPKAMGVHHFGFSPEEIRGWQEAGLSLKSQETIHTINKNGKEYGQFLTILQKI